MIRTYRLLEVKKDINVIIDIHLGFIAKIDSQMRNITKALSLKAKNNIRNRKKRKNKKRRNRCRQ